MRVGSRVRYKDGTNSGNEYIVVSQPRWLHTNVEAIQFCDIFLVQDQSKGFKASIVLPECVKFLEEIKNDTV